MLWLVLLFVPMQVPDLSSGEDPDDAFSRIPYEKGFYFLYYLQVLLLCVVLHMHAAFTW
jgi:hypothetical protein